MMDAQQAFFEEQKKEMGRFQHRIITNRGYIRPEELWLEGKEGLRENGLR